MIVCETRDRILAYRVEHPGATVREIQRACGISSTSVVQHHLERAKHDKTDCAGLVRENSDLRRRLASLRLWVSLPDEKHFPCDWKTDEFPKRMVTLLGIASWNPDCYFAAIPGEDMPMLIDRHDGRVIDLGIYAMPRRRRKTHAGRT